MTRYLLAFDLDGTLVGDPEALARLNADLSARRESWAIAYVTGRRIDSVQRLMSEANLLVPDAIAANVGANLYTGAYMVPDPRWRVQISQGWHADRVHAVAKLFPGLVPQPDDAQSPFKCSYYYDPADVETVRQLVDALRRQRIRAKVVTSSGRDLDVLPAGAGKGNAVRYLAASWGVPLDRVFTVGDSGNDLEMLTLGCLAAMVGNAQPELATAPACVYRASGAYALGVREALEHYGWL
ncbi:MAG TPA: HAD-IIB family hydrolase [Oscillatoriaceae cyanobacterium]